MRNTLQTPFWRAAYLSLPPTVRARCLPHMVRAERWELALDATVEVIARAKGFLSRLFSETTKTRSAH